MECEELETGDEGLGSECSSESGSSSHRGVETGVYPSAYACSLDSLPLVLDPSYSSTIEVNKIEGMRSTWQGDVDLNGTVTSKTKNFGKVIKEERNYRNTNVRYVVYGRAADTASTPEKQNSNYVRAAGKMNGNSPHGKRYSRGKTSFENESNGCGSDFTEPEPFKYINVWRPYSLGNEINGKNNSSNQDEHFCKAITHFAITPSLQFTNGKVGLL